MQSLRSYRADDYDSALALIGGILVEFNFGTNLAGVERDLAEAAERYAAPRAGLWVAEEDGEVVGTVAIRPKEGTTCEIKRLYLRPRLRGSGLGQRLYAHAETFARAAGYESIWLESSRRFDRARRLYERNGFVLLAELDNDWEDNLYEKRL